MPDWMAELAQKAGAVSGSLEEKAEGDARWISDFADELTVAIALREWDQAVTLVEQGQQLWLSVSHHVLTFDQRRSKIVLYADSWC